MKSIQSAPRAEVSNGVKVVNFSSPHPFTFEDGTVLDACTPERCAAMSLAADDQESPSPCGRWTEVSKGFKMTPEILKELENLQREDVDIVLVPFPMLSALGAARGKCATISADRVTKKCSITHFCV